MEPVSGDQGRLDDVVLALCTDHGHLNQAGSLAGRTHRRRAAIVIDTLDMYDRDHDAARFAAQVDHQNKERL